MIERRFPAARWPGCTAFGHGRGSVASIIERHAGTIRVERTADAHTRFVLNLPAVPRHEDPLVDDDPDMLA